MKNANVDIHIHHMDNSIYDAVDVMNSNRLGIIALKALNRTIYPQVVEGIKKHYDITHDDSGIRLPNGTYILNAKEYRTKEKLDVSTIGHSYNKSGSQIGIREIIDNGLENNALVVLDHPFVDNDKTKTAGHISYELEQEVEKLCGEYSGQIAVEWNGYCRPDVRKPLKHILNLFGKETRYHDVNKKAEELAEKMNLPLLADTDLHARNKDYLQAMGTARFIVDVEGETASEVIDSMKKNIFAGKYKNVKKYVSVPHLFGAFCMPVITPNIFKKPRA